MKKFLLVIIMLFPLITLAKEQVNYEWSNNSDKKQYFISETENGYLFAEETEPGNVITYSQKGVKTSTTSVQDYIGTDGSKIAIFSGINNMYYNPGENIMINLTNKELFDCTNINEPCTRLETTVLSESELQRYAGDYYFILNQAIKNNTKVYKNYKYKNNYHIVNYSSSNQKGVEVYNSNGKLIFTKEYPEIFGIASDITENGVYVLIAEEIAEERTDFTLMKYNLNGNEEYSLDLSDKIGLEDGYYPEDITITKDGLIITINAIDSNIAAKKSYIHKYTFLHDITTKINGQGTIDVQKTSKNNETIVVKVTPTDGYVLASIKVTDKNGKSINYTNSSFVMPSSDVVVEATFVLEKTNTIKNPDTIDTILIALPFLIIGGIASTFMYKKVSWLK